MVMNATEAATVGREMVKQLSNDRTQLDILRRYWLGRQPLPLVVPQSAPREVREMARVARVNVIKIVVESITQSMIVDSIRATDRDEDPIIARAWSIWQANGMDRRQFGLTRATTAYGTGYMLVLPGEPEPVMRPYSPRHLTAAYGTDDVWPVRALAKNVRTPGYRLIDDEAVYELAEVAGSDTLTMVGDPMIHNAKYGGRRVCPVIRYDDAEDLDLEDDAADDLTTPISGYVQRSTIVAGQIAPLVDLQDQINLTSFSLKAAEWYSAFRQRWIIGTKLTAEQKVESGASQTWAFDEDPDRMRIGEFAQTDLRGYLDSRAESMKFAAVLSQTPVHELVGELVNLSAEALAAAEVGRDRMIGERRTGAAESHEQALAVAVEYVGAGVLPVDAEMVYRDTSARAFGAVVDGLGKLAQMLQVPPQELWEKVPGATRQDVKRWKEAFEAGDSLAQMNALLDSQAGGGETRTGSGIILPPGVTV